MMGASQQRLKALRESIRELQSAAEATGGEEQSHALRQKEDQVTLLRKDREDLMKKEDGLRETLRSRAEESETLQRSIERQKATESELWEALRNTQAEVKQLLCEKDEEARPANALPAPRDERSLIRSILSSWDQTSGPRSMALLCFQDVDADLDGRLQLTTTRYGTSSATYLRAST